MILASALLSKMLWEMRARRGGAKAGWGAGAGEEGEGLLSAGRVQPRGSLGLGLPVDSVPLWSCFLPSALGLGAAREREVARSEMPGLL